MITKVTYLKTRNQYRVWIGPDEHVFSGAEIRLLHAQIVLARNSAKTPSRHQRLNRIPGSVSIDWKEAIARIQAFESYDSIAASYGLKVTSFRTMLCRARTEDPTLPRRRYTHRNKLDAGAPQPIQPTKIDTITRATEIPEAECS